jgi:sugar phosphate isomerase/epimerase
MKTMKGPAIFLAQFASDEPPFDTLGSMAQWAASLGYRGIQVPSWDQRLLDLERAAESDAYCDEVKGIAGQYNISITELSTHLQGQLVAVHPAYDELFDGFAAAHVRGGPKARTEWAMEQMRLGFTATWPLGQRHLLGRPRVAVPLSLAPAPGRSD